MKFNTLYEIGNEIWIINSLGGFRVEIYRLNTKSCYKQFNMPMHYVKGQYRVYLWIITYSPKNRKPLYGLRFNRWLGLLMTTGHCILLSVFAYHYIKSVLAYQHTMYQRLSHTIVTPPPPFRKTNRKVHTCLLLKQRATSWFYQHKIFFPQAKFKSYNLYFVIFKPWIKW